VPALSAPWRAALAIAAVTLLAGALRFQRLDEPPRKVFDEVYYASDGCWYAGIDYRQCGLDGDVERSWVHPPLGKQLIALGIDAFGNDPFGWRAAAALAGTLTVALVGLLAFLLFSSPVWSAVAALLAGTEHLLFVQSRIAMLDVFLALFVVLGFVFLVADQRRLEPPPPRVWLTEAEPVETQPDVPKTSGWRPFLLLAGVALGAAVAVKWSGVLALLGGIGLAVGWAWRRRKAAGSQRPMLDALRQEGPILYLALLAVPFAAYALTWVPWLADRQFDVLEWFRHHGDMAHYHRTLDTVGEDGQPIHPYMSPAWTWFLLLRPVAYFWRSEPSCCAEILGIGSPALFWGGLMIVPYLTLAWRQARDWRAGAVLIPILSQFLPWLLVTRPLFLFYMTPVAPFLALGTTYALRDLVRSDVRRGVTWAAALLIIAVAVGVFVFFWPILTAEPITLEEWSRRIWFYRGPSVLPNWV
jgi:dolichyl-phosphate-mannose-protein mannosyltransferase